MSVGPVESVVLRFADTDFKGDVLARLDQLAQMHQAAVPTDAGFTEAKSKLLS